MFPCNIFYILLFFFFFSPILVNSLIYLRESNIESWTILRITSASEQNSREANFSFLFLCFLFQVPKKIKIKGVQAKSVCSQFSTGSPKKRAVFEYSSTDREARCNLCKMSLNEPLNMAPNYKLFCTSSGSINAEKRLLSKVSLTLNQSL